MFNERINTLFVSLQFTLPGVPNAFPFPMIRYPDEVSIPVVWNHQLYVKVSSINILLITQFIS